MVAENKCFLLNPKLIKDFDNQNVWIVKLETTGYGMRLLLRNCDITINHSMLTGILNRYYSQVSLTKEYGIFYAYYIK